MSLQSQLPDETAVEAKVKEVIDSSLDKIISNTANTRAKLTKYRRQTLWYLLGFILSIFVLFGQDFLPWTYISVPMFILLIGLNYYGRLWFNSQATLTIELNSILVNLLTEVFGQTFTWQMAPVHEAETKEIFHESGLMIDHIDSLKVDDLYACNQPYPTSFRELYATRQEGSGKSRRTVVVFRGLLVTMTLPKTLQAKTFISTESDSNGFAHSSFWAKTLGRTDIEETKLEWNEFDKYLHVASSDGAEARYILTTDFMEKLYAWWQEGKENIRIKFAGNQMQMLLPDSRIRVSFSTASADPKEIEEYFFSMVKPLWRTLLLAEQIRL